MREWSGVFNAPKWQRRLGGRLDKAETAVAEAKAEQKKRGRGREGGEKSRRRYV